MRPTHLVEDLERFEDRQARAAERAVAAERLSEELLQLAFTVRQDVEEVVAGHDESPPGRSAAACADRLLSVADALRRMHRTEVVRLQAELQDVAVARRDVRRRQSHPGQR